jgi:hypothetical protein
MFCYGNGYHCIYLIMSFTSNALNYILPSVCDNCMHLLCDLITE